MPLMPKFPGLSQHRVPPGSSPSPILPGAPIPPPPSGSQQPPPQVSLASIRFQETADYEKGFSEYFDQKLKPIIRDLEQERLMKLEDVKKIRPKANALALIGTIIGIALTFYFKHMGWLFLIPVAFLIKTAMLSAPKEAVARKYKESIVPLVVKFFGDFNYTRNAEPPAAALKDSGLFDSFNRWQGDDFIEGRYNETHFTFLETNLERRGNKSSTTVFDGIILLVDLGKSFPGRTVIRRESQKGLWASMTGKFKGMQKVSVDNPEFEKKFEVYSTEPGVAPTLLTPDFVARLMKLDEDWTGSAVKCSFYEGKLLLAIGYGSPRKPTAKAMVLGYGEFGFGQLFETGSMDKPLTDTEDIHKFLAQMHAILRIVETVNPSKKGYEEIR